MTFQQSIADCFAEKIGEGGLPRDEFAQFLARAAAAIERLRTNASREAKALLALPNCRDDLDRLAPIAEAWRRRFRRIYLLGIGGSALGARALVDALPKIAGAPELIVLDNLDPVLAKQLADRDAVAESGFLVISKSGGTDETLSQALVAVAAAMAELGPKPVNKHFLMIADPGDRPLRRLAAEVGATVLDHDPAIGGRFSVLSLVGLLPTMMVGLDAAAVRAGAAAVLEANFNPAVPDGGPAVEGAALAVGLNASRGISQTVLFCYDDRLRTFARWYRQLWAESLGKEGKGTTPVDALGPVDQHSQLQLYLDGPWDKMFTVMTLPRRGTGPVIDSRLAATVGMEHIAGRHVGDLVAAMQHATAETLADRGRPVRTLALKRLDAETLGGLFMHFFLETLISAELLKVDPFGQPAVDAGKILARRYLVEANKRNGSADVGDCES